MRRRKARLIRPGGDQKRRNPARFIGTLTARVQVCHRNIPKPCRAAQERPPGQSAGGPICFGRRTRVPHLSTSSPCTSPSMNPTSRRIPERFCASALVSESRPILSSRPGSRRPTGLFAAPAWIISMPLRSCDIVRGKISKPGGAARAIASCCLRPRRPSPISTTATPRTTFCCSAANPRACRRQVHAAADARLKIPMRPGLRSLNVAVAAAMAAGEALRQTGETRASP